MPDLNAGFPDRWISVDEVAEYLGITRDTVYKWIARKRMPGHKIGRLWKFRRSEIDEWVKSEKHTPTDPPTFKASPLADRQEKG